MKELIRNKGVKIKTIEMIFIVVVFLTILFLGAQILSVSINYRKLVREMNLNIESNEYMRDFENASDDMTEQSRLFVVSKNIEHMDKYFEVVNNRVRETAKDNIENCFNSVDDEKLKIELNSALNESNSLMNYEIHAMKLIVVVIGLDENLIPDLVKTFELDASELSLSSSEKEQLALDLVVGEEYKENKNQIKQDIHNALNSISSKLENNISIGVSKIWESIYLTGILCIISAIAFTIFLTIMYKLVIRPLQAFVKNINEDNPVEVIGSYEFKYLALTFNNMYEIKLQNKKRMDFELEHDALTGIYSRYAFDKKIEELSKTKEPLALIMIDVDKFKNINDTYGHQIGDMALKKVADLLKENFNDKEFVARYGGDEFSIIMDYFSNKDYLEKKINDINEILKNSKNNFVQLSISAGIAFSKTGYSEDLFKKADDLLYKAKSLGRCGCAIDEEINN